MKSPDIDIDVRSSTDKSKYGTRAMIYDEEHKQIRPHPSGYYYDDQIPIDPLTGFSAIDSEEAEELGFQKIDLLTNTVYDVFRNKQEVLQALNTEPDWSKLSNEKFVKKLPHIGSHFELVLQISPKSIIELADTLALIRPGKRHLLESYLKNPQETRKNLYRKPKKGFYFKKSHAVAYAAMIVCYMNRITAHGLLKYSNRTD